MIQNAIIIAIKSTNDAPDFDTLYGGETLIGRALVAMSKSGMKYVTIICRMSDRTLIERCVKEVDAERISVSPTIHSMDDDVNLSKAVNEITKSSESTWMLMTYDKIIHPTFILPVRECVQTPALITYNGVMRQGDKVIFGEEMAPKFQTQFQDVSIFDMVSVQDNKVKTWNTADAPHFSAGILVARNADLVLAETWQSISELIKFFITKELLKTVSVSNGWCMPVNKSIPPSVIKNVFWKMAFKEISGEFSKAVNSKLSKPLTFWFSAHQYKPDTISNMSLVLFIVASGFLLIPEYWAMVVFAVVWQFSAGVLDRCDGEVARMRNHESEAGGKFDMIVDDLRFALPLMALGVACSLELPDVRYAIVAAITLAGSFAITFFEQATMRRFGYVSRQKLNVDYLKAKGDTSRFSTTMKKLQPVFKGDIRTFYVFLLTFLGEKTIIFWVLVFYHVFVSALALFGALTFPRLIAKMKK
ncbi:CDP-alcohol phosphatidyltransferase family protein [bacterium]|nr:CDP-alcohol phosphatidyltransferase family protein [bacterium]